MKCIIAIEDPTDYIDDPAIDWSRTGGDPRVFLESKKVWEKTIKNLKDPDFQILFVKAVPSLAKGQCEIENNTLKVHGFRDDKRYLEFNISMIHSIEKNFEFDFLLTTTLGCFWVLPRLKKVLESLPKAGIYTGRKWDAGSLAWPPWEFISGSGIVYSRDVVNTLITHRHLIETNACPCDDAIIGLFMLQNGIAVLRQDWWMDLDQNTIDDLDKRLHESDARGIIQYRVKNGANRIYFDPIILNKLWEHYFHGLGD
jgi:hypothetical protein